MWSLKNIKNQNMDFLLNIFSGHFLIRDVLTFLFETITGGQVYNKQSNVVIDAKLVLSLAHKINIRRFRKM